MHTCPNKGTVMKKGFIGNYDMCFAVIAVSYFVARFLA